MASIQALAEELIRSLGKAAVNATPRLALAVLFLVTAIVLVRLTIGRIKRQLEDISGNPAQERFLELLVQAVLWFGIILIALSLLGFQQLATALGTASGFLALGVAYGLRQALSEALAGFYLIKDDRFIQGEWISTDDETGIIEHIGLRRTKLRSEDGQELTVIANDRIESKWTLHEDGNPAD